MDSFTAIEKLEELKHARGTLDEWEIARRAAAILDRSDLRELDLTDYLIERKLEGVALARFMPRFASRVAQLYEAQHGARPLKRLKLIAELKDYRPVFAYVEHDRELCDRAWRELNADWSETHECIGALA